MARTDSRVRSHFGGGARHPGFTLIELLVVIAIIAILAAILFPVFSKARAKARTATCVSNLKQYSLAIIMYCGDHDGYGPFNKCGNFVSRRLDLAGCGPREDSAMYSCPEGGSYGMLGWRGGHCMGAACATTPWNLEFNGCGKVRHPEGTLLVADAQSPLVPITAAGAGYFYDVSGGGRNQPRHQAVNNVAFCDGHVKGLVPQLMYEDLVAGESDADGDGKADGYKTGRGNWYHWDF